MAAKKKKLETFLILLCGLPATGKTTVAEKLAKDLPNYVVIDQNKIRRQMGYQRMPKNRARNHDKVLRRIDRLVVENLLTGRGVIVDSVNRFTFRRLQIYGIASGCGVRGLTLEVVCPEKMAKARMMKRPNSDGFVSDPYDTKVYNRLKEEWEPVEIDHINFGSDHFSYLLYDSHTNKTVRKIEQKGTKGFIGKIERIITKK